MKATVQIHSNHFNRHAQVIDFISFWCIVGNSSRCLCRATQAHKLWGQASSVFRSCCLTEPGSARTCVWRTMWALAYKVRSVPEARVWLQQWERQGGFWSCFTLGQYLLESFDKATGKCFLPKDHFFVTIRSEIFIPSQIESRRNKSFTRRLWENFCFPREDYFLKVC